MPTSAAFCGSYNRWKTSGLGYVTLGQSSSTLSGGEAQRVKLAFYLGTESTAQKVFFIFDEPTTGLHFHDVRKLLKALNALVEQGHTVLVVEHNLDMMAAADYLIDSGAGCGAAGREVVVSGRAGGLGGGGGELDGEVFGGEAVGRAASELRSGATSSGRRARQSGTLKPRAKPSGGETVHLNVYLATKPLIAMTEQDIKAGALALPAPSRAQLIHELLDSLNQGGDFVFEQEWIEEVRRRADEVASGASTMLPVRDAIAEARARFQ